VWNDIRSGPGTYQIRTNVVWKGKLTTAIGIGGARANASIAIHIVDLSGRDIVAPQIVHELELTQSAVSVGLFDAASPPGGQPVVFDFTIPRSFTGTWRIELRAMCEARSGLVAADVWCSYDDALPGVNGFVAYAADRDGFVLYLDKTIE
jgi:hypothetical protein